MISMSAVAGPVRAEASPDALARFIDRHPRLFVLTGAGCSTASGIPDYRDAAGEWKRRQPITYQDFVAHERSRQRYWARSLAGFRRLRTARPNDAHHALAALEQRGHVAGLVTQNVDGLHQAAGSQQVIDLHGRIDTVRCLGCGRRSSRQHLQVELERRNPAFAALEAVEAPDGDADLDGVPFESVRRSRVRPLPRDVEAGCRVLRRGGAAGTRATAMAMIEGGRWDAGDRVVADGLFRVSLRQGDGAKPASRLRQ